jgi:hypothetical protein
MALLPVSLPNFGFELSPHTAIDRSVYYILDVRADRDAQATREDMAYAKVVVDAGVRNVPGSPDPGRAASRGRPATRFSAPPAP